MSVLEIALKELDENCNPSRLREPTQFEGPALYDTAH